MLGSLGELLAERDRTAPEFRCALRVDEDAVPDLAGNGRAEREQPDWHEDRQRALVRMITAAARRNVMRIMRAVAMLFVRRVVVAVERVLDMHRSRPAR